MVFRKLKISGFRLTVYLILITAIFCFFFFKEIALSFIVSLGSWSYHFWCDCPHKPNAGFVEIAFGMNTAYAIRKVRNKVIAAVIRSHDRFKEAMHLLAAEANWGDTDLKFVTTFLDDASNRLQDRIQSIAGVSRWASVFSAIACLNMLYFDYFHWGVGILAAMPLIAYLVMEILRLRNVSTTKEQLRNGIAVFGKEGKEILEGLDAAIQKMKFEDMERIKQEEKEERRLINISNSRNQNKK